MDFRPSRYFGPKPLNAYLLSKVKNAVLRENLKQLDAEGRHDEVKALLGSSGIDARTLKALERLHPRLMGGNYLPETGEREVEIARIAIASTTGDVTSVYARQLGGAIGYRVVDEYGGDTLQGPGEMESALPLTLGELMDFFMGTWPLEDVVEMNFEGDLEGGLGFFSASSEFYPGFDAACRDRVRSHYG
jgi:hypothetical protein